MRAGDADLERPLRIRDHRDGSDFGAGAGRGRYRDKGKDRARHLELAIVILELAAVADEQPGAFGHIEATAAADADHHIRPEPLRLRDTGAHAVARHVRQGAIIDERVDPGSLQPIEHLDELRRAGEPFVGAHECAPAISTGNGGQRMALTFAEENFARQARGCKKGHGLRSFERDCWKSVVFIGGAAVSSEACALSALVPTSLNAGDRVPSPSVHILYKIV
ncbi:hypothetical protein MPL3356_300181 [Mesorhizobium plurifarium]|uniref:Uncharacterized protein n=1 Tax=Mesorhizobium plurifarium TaxID=69974 RepID=A0A090DYU1_MESPL|nr:hypothetical protein MPL3356_300181 [Mesorhizobium plurifarium]